VLVLLAMFIQHALLHSNLLIGRTALIFLPLLSLVFLSAIRQIKMKTGNFLLGGATTILVCNFIFSANFHYAYDYREQTDVKNMMKMLKEQQVEIAESAFASVLTTDLPYEQQVNYYRMRFKLETFGHVPRREEVPGTGWYYLPEAELENYPDAKIIREFPFTGTVLFHLVAPYTLKNAGEAWQDFENEYPFPMIISDTIFFGEKGNSAGGKYPYSSAVSFRNIDTMQVKPVAATLSCRLRTPTRNTSALLVFQFITEHGIESEMMHLSELSEKPGQWSVTTWTRPLPPDTKTAQVFIWNRDKTNVYLDNVLLRILTAEK
jgi:hypothetical protein